ncbi:sigma-54-dependent Fis family transcriptional regulator [Azoarcus olearius]|uniref:Sigma-54 dependent transcriptional regulator n=1 Tax=Azoarcus sp. (strain BH72) TaxID=418699 RepID=A1K4T7_AZOSB|nr:sigma-54-dependent Fis family transcriptional regulator [Azoarcus olearius]ANQ84393.1 sigma-54 dependent transcriptional regulator [Azoarcus olearius]CAL93842.1 Sigma-54 dependent transcriptional regulator [Azoarcus olearius]
MRELSYRKSGVRFSAELRPNPAAQCSGRELVSIDRATYAAWERFVTGEALPPSTIESPVLDSWRRSRDAGVNPVGRAAPVAARGDDMELLRRRHRELMAAASNLFAHTGDLLAGSHSIMLLTSPEGVVLDAAGDAATLDAARDIHLMTGGNWCEAVVGTNGIGTAIATRCPAQIHGAEHFCEGIQGWTCAAAPIFEPGTQDILGVLDISGPPQTFQRNNLLLAVSVARQIEMALSHSALGERLRLLEHCMNRLSLADAAGMVAIDRQGRLIHSAGRVPLPVGVGERLPGFRPHADLEEWAAHLPEGLRPEWLHPVVAGGRTVGAVVLVPGRGVRNSPVARLAEQSSEADPRRSCFDNILGRSPAMREATDLGRRLATKRVPVLVEGETGVGKELFARALHGGEHLGGPFITYNCGAASKELIAADLFGHVRGAFTGATNDGRPGRFELANGGTLCLDEIGEMPLDLQPVLLRALEEGIVYRLGDTQPRRVDVRLIAMTNRNLREEVAAGRFRRDLYYRIGVTRLRIPPLRERDGDIPLLASHFCTQLAERHGVPRREFGPEVLDALQAYCWPGNVRELRNVVESLLLMDSTPQVRVDELPEEILASVPQAARPAAEGAEPECPSLEAAERRAIQKAVINFQGNLAQAARLLGISRSTLYRKVERYALEDFVRAAGGNLEGEGGAGD